MTTLSEMPRKVAHSHDWQVVYIDPEKIEDYNACYRVELEGKEISPDAADDLGIPMNDIWISEKLRDFEKYILFHEIREIKYRAQGHDGNTAHSKALEDEKIFQGEPEWEKLRKEINIASKNTLAELAGINDDTFDQIKSNRPYYRLKELEDLSSLDREIYLKLKEKSWSLYQA